MSQNRKLHKQLRSERANFYITDFHVHSPASVDVRLSPRFEQLSHNISELLVSIPENTVKNPVEYESQVIQVYPPSIYYNSLVERRNALLSEVEADDGDDWAVVAITDHNVCRYACMVASYAWANIKENRLIVLPGIELSVSYSVPPDDSSATAHLLCIFSSDINDSDIRMAIRDAADVNWSFGEKLELQSLSIFVNKIRNHPNYPAICIAAHVGSSHGVQSETKNTILSRLEAAISRVSGEIQTGTESDKEALHERLELLKHERDKADQVSLHILDLIGKCGFDALQVRSRKDEVHYRRLHRFREEMGRAVPIVCSDAHRQEDIFVTESGVPHLKLSGLSSKLEPQEIFRYVRQALRFGETRFSFVIPETPQYWISGIEITPDASEASQFWPFRQKTEGKPATFVLPFSRNLNCLIGGRGSGKSAALEALAFLLKGSDFNDFAQKREEDIPDYYKRARATLAGCNLKVCLQFLKHEETKDFPKKAVFASRYFDNSDRHQPATYFNVDNMELLSQQVPLHKIQYYRLGEIEKQAGSTELRILFDQICGNKIQEHEQKISELIGSLKGQRKDMVEISQKIADLTQSDSPLCNYVKRKLLYDKVNTTEIKEAYEEVDKIAVAESRANLATEDWTTIQNEFALDKLSKQVIDFFDQLNDDCIEKGQPKPYLEKLVQISAGKNQIGDDSQTLRERVANAVQTLDKELNSVEKGITEAKNEIDLNAKAIRDALQKKGLPTGSKDREAKKAAFEEAESALATYRDLNAKWDTMNKARKKMVNELQDECKKRSKLRQETAQNITIMLRRDLDPCVLVVEADAQAQSDKKLFIDWLDTNFSSQEFKHRKARIEALISQELTPAMLRNLLLDEGEYNESILKVEKKTAEDGAINKTAAKNLRDRCMGRCRLECEVVEGDVDVDFWGNLPQEIKDGLFSFPIDDRNQNMLKINNVLQLDEITYNDIPVIRLNDRPKDEKSKPRSLEELSPGQRCSAILPIVLLTGTSPLLIDQPEDNLDNRLIRQVIINILSSIKLRRQVILATHNPNLPVLGDVEQAIILQGVGERECEIRAIGDLDSGEVVHNLTEVMEGGREAFQYRHTIYQAHWPGSVSTIDSDS